MAAWQVVLDEIIEEEDESYSYRWSEGCDDNTPRGKRTRRVSLRVDYAQAPWWAMLQQAGLQNHALRTAEIFRWRFSIPCVFFAHLVALVKEDSVPV